MDACQECGSRDVALRAVEGGVVLECGLCGALSGEPSMVQRLSDSREAEAAGVGPAVWPLVRTLDKLPGIAVHDSDAGDPGRGHPPWVRWLALDGRALVQVENLATTLHLLRAALLLPWTIEVEHGGMLLFALRVRMPAGTGGGDAGPRARAAVERARDDLATLQRAIDRNQRLSWWRHP